MKKHYNIHNLVEIIIDKKSIKTKVKNRVLSNAYFKISKSKALDSGLS